MRGFIQQGLTADKGVEINLNDDYTVVKDAWDNFNIISKKDALSNYYPEERKVFVKVDQMPILASCTGESSLSGLRDCSNKRLARFIYDNIQYPKEAQWNGIEGTVNVQFTVELDGTISNLHIAKSVKQLDEEVLRVMNLLNEQNIRWNPGRQNKEYVRVVKNIPIEFSIGTDSKYAISVMKLKPKKHDTTPSFMKSFLENIESKTLQINISPNPAHENIQLSIKGSKKPLLIQVTDMTGRALYEQKIKDFSGSSVETILFEERVKGMVIVTIIQGEHSVQEKVVVR